LIKEPDTIREAKFFKVSEIEKMNSQVNDEVTEFLLERLNTGEIVHLIGKEIVRFHAIY
jgi:methionyl-tRNA synthetase